MTGTALKSCEIATDTQHARGGVVSLDDTPVGRWNGVVDRIEELQVARSEVRAFIREMVSLNADRLQRGHQIARANRAFLLRARISD